MNDYTNRDEQISDLTYKLEIAEAEIKRLTKMLDVCAVTHDHNVKLKAEVDRLKSELARLQQTCSIVNPANHVDTNEEEFGIEVPRNQPAFVDKNGRRKFSF